MTAIALETSLAEIARDQPSSTQVFLRHRLDFCCGGRRSLGEACARAGLDAAQILHELAEAAARPGPSDGWARRSLAELANYIEHHYHAALRRDLPSLIEAAHKVERVHAAKPGVPAGLGAVLARFALELEDHMRKEERVLFPLVRQGARGELVYLPVRMMEREHDGHAAHLAELRRLTGDLAPPPHACATWRALYHGLARIEEDLMQHIHLENNVLFPRVRELVA